MELTNIRTIPIGAIYFIIIVNKFCDLKGEEIFTSSISIEGFTTNPTNKQVNNATIGINTLLLMKSQKSKIEKPNSFISLQIPNPKEEGIPTIMANTKITIQVV